MRKAYLVVSHPSEPPAPSLSATHLLMPAFWIECKRCWHSNARLLSRQKTIVDSSRFGIWRIFLTCSMTSLCVSLTSASNSR